MSADYISQLDTLLMINFNLQSCSRCSDEINNLILAISTMIATNILCFETRVCINMGTLFSYDIFTFFYRFVSWHFPANLLCHVFAFQMTSPLDTWLLRNLSTFLDRLLNWILTTLLTISIISDFTLLDIFCCHYSCTNCLILSVTNIIMIEWQIWWDWTAHLLFHWKTFLFIHWLLCKMTMLTLDTLFHTFLTRSILMMMLRRAWRIKECYWGLVWIVDGGQGR